MADTLTLLGPINLARLSDPFPADAISWRVGATNSDKSKGLALAYIDARDVMNRLDEVCGQANWQDEYVETPKGRILCRIGIKCASEWVWKGDGAGDSDVEAEKGAISDALKRAGVKWGIGRYLYEMPATWVEIEQRGKTSVIKDSERAKLARVAAGGGPSSPPRQQQPREKVVNPETGRLIDPGSPNQLRKTDAWANFERTVRAFTDLDALESWWADASTQTKIDQQPEEWQIRATDEYEKAQERLLNAGRP